MIKTGRIQCAILESLPASIDELETQMVPSAIHVVYTAILTLYLRQWVEIDR